MRVRMFAVVTHTHSHSHSFSVPVTIEKLNFVDAINDLSRALDRLSGIKYLIENIHPEPVRPSSGER